MKDDKKLIDKILFGLKKFKLTQDKLTLTKTRSKSNFERLTKKKKEH